jgi:NAD(P)-dependent dehydrogenase (short-subunit alcohol dehydrogenase family)
MTTVSLAGKVIALAGRGSDSDRAAAISCAEAGADLALATLAPDQASEFGMNSIANEAWVLGSEQFVRVMDATDPNAIAAFVEETWARYGGCNAFVVTTGTPLALAEAFSRRMGGVGGGIIVVCLGGEGLAAELSALAAEGVSVRLAPTESEVGATIAG